MLKPGDKVLYPLHGAGIIDDIIKKENDGTEKSFFVVSLINSTMKISIPVENAKENGVRPIVSENEVNYLLDNFNDIELESDTNWNKRCRDNIDLLKDGDIEKSAAVYKDLMQRNSIKSLSAGERKIMLNARQMLSTEFMLVLNISKDDAETLLNDALKK